MSESSSLEQESSRPRQRQQVRERAAARADRGLARRPDHSPPERRRRRIRVDNPARRNQPVSPMATRFTLEPVAPFRLDLTAWALCRRPGNTVDRWEGDTYRRTLRLTDAIRGDRGPPDWASRSTPARRIGCSGPAWAPHTRRSDGLAGACARPRRRPTRLQSKTARATSSTPGTSSPDWGDVADRLRPCAALGPTRRP